MKKKSKVLFIVIAVSVIAIIYSQGVWIYGSYILKSDETREKIVAAWVETVKEYTRHKNDSIKNVISSRLGRYYQSKITFSRDTLFIGIIGRGPERLPETGITPAYELGNIKVKLEAAAAADGITTVNPMAIIAVMDKAAPPFNVQESIDSVAKSPIRREEKALSREEKALSLVTGHRPLPEILFDGVKKLQERLESAKLAKELPWKTDSLALARLYRDALLKRGLTLSFIIDYEVTGGKSVDYEHVPFALWNGSGMTYLPFSSVNRYFEKGNRYWVEAMVDNGPGVVFRRMLQVLISSALLTALIIFSFIYLARTILRQKRLAEMKDDFINNMTHELKTPIATIAVAIEGMQKFNVLNDKEKTGKYLETSRLELTKLNELITKVLNMAAYEKKDINLDLEKINVTELLNGIITNEQLREVKPVRFTIDNQFGDGPILVDKLHFTNSLANLVDNAVKYSGETVQIDISCYSTGDRVYFTVKDNGTGISHQHLSRIFDKFYRVPKGNIHAVKGTGLGLSYVRHVVTMHGGEIAVKSEPGKGSEFSLWIPLTPPAR